MDNIEGGYKLIKHEKTLLLNGKYQELNLEIVKLEKEILAKADSNTSKLFLKYTNLLTEQNIIFTDELLKI